MAEGQSTISPDDLNKHPPESVQAMQARRTDQETCSAASSFLEPCCFRAAGRGLTRSLSNILDP